MIRPNISRLRVAYGSRSALSGKLGYGYQEKPITAKVKAGILNKCHAHEDHKSFASFKNKYQLKEKWQYTFYVSTSSNITKHLNTNTIQQMQFLLLKMA